MSHSLTAVIGLGVILGTAAPAQPEPVQSDDLAQVEIAPGAAIPPLGSPHSGVPSFALMNDIAASAAMQAGVPASSIIGASGLTAFGPEGVRLPAYEAPEIATGSLTRIPRR